MDEQYLTCFQNGVAIILSTFTETQALELVERIRVEISKIVIPYDDLKVSCTCSFGIVAYSDDLIDIYDMIKRADNA